MAALVVLVAIAIACAATYLALLVWDRVERKIESRDRRRQEQERERAREEVRELRRRDIERRAHVRD